VKAAPIGVLLLLSAPSAVGQDLASQSLRRNTWELGLWAAGGKTLKGGARAEFFQVGARVGRVLTNQHLKGWARGNFEWAADLMPAYVAFQRGQTVYGGSLTPLILKWNFTRSRRVAPFLELAGGLLFTDSKVPPGDTSKVNFTPGGGFGVHVFTRANRAVTFESHFTHISNAQIGSLNPGFDAVLMFRVGYTWFK